MREINLRVSPMDFDLARQGPSIIPMSRLGDVIFSDGVRTFHLTEVADEEPTGRWLLCRWTRIETRPEGQVIVLAHPPDALHMDRLAPTTNLPPADSGGAD